MQHLLLYFYLHIKALERDKNNSCDIIRVSKSISIQLPHNEKGQVEIICLTRVQISPTQCPELGSVISFCSAGVRVFEGKESASTIAMTEVGQSVVEEHDGFWRRYS